MKNVLLLFLGLLLITFEVSGQKKSFIPDTSINGISLYDTTSLLAVIPEIKEYIDHTGLEAQASYLNNNGTEILTLIFHPGSNANEVAEIIVERFSNKKELPSKINEIETFKTNNGIELSIDKQVLINCIGNDYKMERDNETETLVYIINDFENSELLRRYNMPEYYAEYTFKKNKLTAFKFGFTYP